MKDVANQTSLIKQRLGHFPTFITWRLSIRASKGARVTALGDGNLAKRKENENLTQAGQLSCG